MANFFKYVTNKNDGKISVSQDFNSWYRAIVIVVFVIVSLILFPRAESYKFSELKEGSISSEEIIAPFTFFVQKNPEELEKERQKARDSVLPVFQRSENILNSAVDSLNTFFSHLQNLLVSQAEDSNKYQQVETLLHHHNVLLGSEEKKFLNQMVKTSSGKRSSDTATINQFLDELEKILNDIYSYGVLNINKKDFTGEKLQIVNTNRENIEEKSINSVYTVDEAKERMLEKLRNVYGEDSDYVKVGFAILDNYIHSNLTYDAEETIQRINAAVSKVPIVKNRILKGERIIDSHERVTAENVEVLRSLAQEIVKREAQSGIFSLLTNWFARLLLLLLTMVPLTMFLYFQRRRIWNDLRMLFIIFSTMLFVVVLSAVILHYQYPKYLIPIAAVPIIITSYQDTRTGFFVGLSLSLLIGAQNGIDFEIALIGMLTCTSAIFALGISKYRKRLANSTIFIFIAYFIGITVFGIIRYVSFSEIAAFWGSAAITSIFASMVAYGFIMLFDAVFDVASEFKLIELSDLNNPLLKLLSMRAPGSYHHSIQVSNVSEAAAEAIGANALLTKVGAYYHDIGKMFKPEYFVENQRGGKNPHDRLSPRLSSLILINHVRKGYEFAKQNKLPTMVCKFIVEHHGSSLMKFFYEKAKEKSDVKDILETDFRYPGTKPQSKETGILMLADSVEATVRSIKEPTLNKIRNAIRNIVEDKIHSGELDDCPLTMKDIGIIVEVFSHVLLGVHHGRIEYPGQKDIIRKPVIEVMKGKDIS